MRFNIITGTDSYKQTHHRMYPKGTEGVYSYFEARDGAQYPETVFFGLQAIIARYFQGCRVTRSNIEEAAHICKIHFGDETIFNRPMWEFILDKYKGALPIRIRAVPEGMVVPIDNVMMTVENTGGPITAPLTNHCETILSQIWYPCTVATMSRAIKKICKEFLEKTGGDMGHLDFMLHDFGYRGVSSVESAGMGGAAHLINFKGTDTLRAMEWAAEYYYAMYEDLAFSVPATEHSVMTSLGRVGEAGLFRHLLEQYPKGILSVVIDSYNYADFISTLALNFKDEILAREGKLVFRPDSGDPVGVTVDCLRRLEDVFGATVNAKGYKKLNPKVGLLWGDGIDIKDVYEILDTASSDGFAADNLVFGMGGGLLQKVNRDIQRFAFKSSAQCRGGIWCDVRKDPIEGSKASKAGRLCLTRVEGAHGSAFKTVKEVDLDKGAKDYLDLVFEDGVLIRSSVFSDVRKRAAL